ncbi:MAG: type II secretion system protein [Planctomycetes bacterium]|nr:type II secretion system protein [Planctomycetota bacterium]
MRLNRHRCGFSLIELVTSLAIISILLVAMGSAMVIATRGMPDPTSPFARKMDAAQVVGQLADEVTYATAVLTMSCAGSPQHASPQSMIAESLSGSVSTIVLPACISLWMNLLSKPD